MTTVQRCGLALVLMVACSPALPNPFNPWVAWAVMILGLLGLVLEPVTADNK